MLTIKIVIAVASLFISSIALCQSNEKGTLQLGAGAWITLGGSSFKSAFDNSREVKGSGIEVKANAGINAQYGMSEKVSAGISIKREVSFYSTAYSYSDPYFTPPATDISTAGFSFGAEGKYYLINKNPYNLFVGPSLGFYTGNSTLKVYNAEGSLNGLTYGVGGGFNWYWGYNDGMAFDFAFMGQSLSGSPDNASDFANHP
ncbi:MAG: hypothetical protein ABIT08_02595, partial [Bacteroidia bacterium]